MGHQPDSAASHSSLSSSVLSPRLCPLICPTLAWRTDEDVMGDSVRGLAEMKADSVHCCPLTYPASGDITEGYQVGQAWFPLDESMLTTLDNLLLFQHPEDGIQNKGQRWGWLACSFPVSFFLSLPMCSLFALFCSVFLSWLYLLPLFHYFPNILATASQSKSRLEWKDLNFLLHTVWKGKSVFKKN